MAIYDDVFVPEFRRITVDGVDKPTVRRRSSSFRASNESSGEMTTPGSGSTTPSLSRNNSFSSTPVLGDSASPFATDRSGSFSDKSKQGRKRFNSAEEVVRPDMSFGGSFGKKA